MTQYLKIQDLRALKHKWRTIIARKGKFLELTKHSDSVEKSTPKEVQKKGKLVSHDSLNKRLLRIVKTLQGLNGHGNLNFTLRDYSMSLSLHNMG